MRLRIASISDLPIREIVMAFRERAARNALRRREARKPAPFEAPASHRGHQKSVPLPGW